MSNIIQIKSVKDKAPLFHKHHSILKQFYADGILTPVQRIPFGWDLLTSRELAIVRKELKIILTPAPSDLLLVFVTKLVFSSPPFRPFASEFHQQTYLNTLASVVANCPEDLLEDVRSRVLEQTLYGILPRASDLIQAVNAACSPRLLALQQVEILHDVVQRREKEERERQARAKDRAAFLAAHGGKGPLEVMIAGGWTLTAKPEPVMTRTARAI